MHRRATRLTTKMFHHFFVVQISACRVQILFLNGKHSLSNRLTISNFNTVVIKSFGNTTFISLCQYIIWFERISFLRIDGVSFVECSTEIVVCRPKHILFLDILRLLLNNVDFVRYGRTDSDNSDAFICDFPLKVGLYRIFSLTVSGVSFIGYKNLVIFVNIFQVESTLFQDTLFQYTDVALIGTAFDILNSRANFLTLDSCVEVEKTASQINIVGSVLNETSIIMCSSELDCTHNFLHRSSCATNSFRFSLKLHDTFIQARKEIGCNAISVTVNRQSDVSIDLQDVVYAGAMFLLMLYTFPTV